VIFIFCKKLFN